MSNNFTITLSLGSGPEAEELASKIKAWAADRPVSRAIRDLIKADMDRKSDIGLKAQSHPHQ